jgi:hypothetical protein
MFTILWLLDYESLGIALAELCMLKFPCINV